MLKLINIIGVTIQPHSQTLIFLRELHEIDVSSTYRIGALRIFLNIALYFDRTASAGGDAICLLSWRIPFQDYSRRNC